MDHFIVTEYLSHSCTLTLFPQVVAKQPLNTMRQFILIGFLFLSAAMCAAESLSTKSISTQGVDFEVICAPDFALTSNVWLEYVLTNHSGLDLAATRASLQIYDMKVQLIDPDGHLIISTIELPGHIPKTFSRARVLVGNGERAFRGQLSISDYFELRKVGRYRCVISKSCAFVKTEIKDDVLSMKDMRPLILTSPEFYFEVKQIDPDYAERISKAAEFREHINKLPPAGSSQANSQPHQESFQHTKNAHGISLHSEVSTTAPTLPRNDEPTSSTPWSIIVVLIVLAIGLLWLLLKGRK